VKVVSGLQLGVELCEKLGLDPARVRSARIVLEPGELAIVQVDMLLDAETEGVIEQFIRTHDFVAVEDL
jgi:ethanolamine utilization microcompartment shell protein EutS